MKIFYAWFDSNLLPPFSSFPLFVPAAESADMDLYVVEPTKGLSCPSPRIVSVSLVCFFLFAIGKHCARARVCVCV